MGQPAALSVDLYNKLINLPYSETTEIGRIAWRLRSARARSPGDPRIAAAYLQALLMSGQADEAIELADQIWAWRRVLEVDVALSFGCQLLELGMYKRSLDLLRSRFTPAELIACDSYGSVIQNALALGDIGLLKEVVSGLPHSDRLGPMVRLLDQSGLRDYFAEHQRIVAAAVFGKQTGYLADVVEVNGRNEFRNTIFVRGERRERRALEERIDAALDEYYASAGLPPGAHAPWLSTVVLDVRAHWSPKYIESATKLAPTQ